MGIAIKRKFGCVSSMSSGVRSLPLNGCLATNSFMFEKRQSNDREEKLETQLSY